MFASTLMFKVVRQSGTEAGCRRQEMLFPENYQSEAGWAIYGDGDCADDQKLLAMAKRLRALGTTRLTEKSLGNAAMCALYKNGPSSTDALINTRKLKFFLLSQHQPMQIQGPDVYPRYPRAPETLENTHLALWHQISEDGAIVQSKVAEFDMATIKSTVACRSTKSGSNLPAYGGHRQIHTAPMPKQMAGLMRPMGWAYASEWLFWMMGRNAQSLDRVAHRTHMPYLPDVSRQCFECPTCPALQLHWACHPLWIVQLLRAHRRVHKKVAVKTAKALVMGKQALPSLDQSSRRLL